MLAQNVPDKKAYEIYSSRLKYSLTRESFNDPFVQPSVKRRLRRIETENHRHATDMMVYAKALSRTKSTLRAAF